MSKREALPVWYHLVIGLGLAVVAALSAAAFALNLPAGASTPSEAHVAEQYNLCVQASYPTDWRYCYTWIQIRFPGHPGTYYEDGSVRFDR